MLELFPALFFTYSTEYPESGTRIQLGRSYQFDTLPEAPDQRKFTLMVQGMTYFTDPAGAIDQTIQPGRNLALLEQFYQDHRLARSFRLAHPIYGEIEVKFLKPLQVPQGIANGNGMVPAFQVELIEIP